MSQVDPRTLDYSKEMRGYFRDVVEILMDRYQKSPEEAGDLVSRYFSIDVDPLERALLMHTAAENVAADLARGTTPMRSPDQNDGRSKSRGRSQLAAG